MLVGTIKERTMPEGALDFLEEKSDLQLREYLHKRRKVDRAWRRREGRRISADYESEGTG